MYEERPNEKAQIRHRGRNGMVNCITDVPKCKILHTVYSAAAVRSHTTLVVREVRGKENRIPKSSALHSFRIYSVLFCIDISPPFVVKGNQALTDLDMYCGAVRAAQRELHYMLQ